MGARVVTPPRRTLVILGLSITSSWGNGHATTYRALVRALAGRGHEVLFLERDVEWYAANRDLPNPPGCRTVLYGSIDELVDLHGEAVRLADCVVVGSYVPDGIAVGDWVLETAAGVTAFYDIDTPITLAALGAGEPTYLDARQIRRYDLYLSFAGGPALETLERDFGAARARALYCSFDPAIYYPVARAPRWDLGYMGTYSDDRQPGLERLLMEPARALPDCVFAVAGPNHRGSDRWPINVTYLPHLAPHEHRAFYTSQRFTLNLTRAEMRRVGYSPSVRLFEAAACGTPVVSDWWPGLDQFFTPGRDLLIAETPEHVRRYLTDVSPSDAAALGARARAHVLAEHAPHRRADQLETYVAEVLACRRERAS
jgi:spore maturation protein CgeB